MSKLLEQIDKKVFSITMDTSANYRGLRKLESLGFIVIEKVNLENNNKRVKTLHSTVGILGAACFPFRLGPYEDYEKILSIIGKKNAKDAMILEAHIHSENDYFVTEDTDFLKKREELEREFSIKIFTPVELEKTFQ